MNLEKLKLVLEKSLNFDLIKLCEPCIIALSPILRLLNVFMLLAQVGAGESHNIGLRFTPQQTPGSAQILIFINDSEDKNEETFSITAVYS